MVVGAEHVDRPVEAAVELVGEVDDVGGAVGRRAGLGADQDAVVVVAVGRRARPRRPVALVRVQPRQELGSRSSSLCFAQESKWIRKRSIVASIRFSICGTGSSGSAASSAM